MTSIELNEDVRNFIAESVNCLDEDRLEDWVGFFGDDAVYRVMSRENYDRGLPLSLLSCDGLDMIQDRITSLRNANIYNIHWDCHVLGRTLIKECSDSLISTITSYCLYQTSQEGVSYIFSAGKYYDSIEAGSDGLKIVQRIVVSDTGAIKSNLSTPI